MTDDLVARLRSGRETCGTDACAIRDAKSGCLCAIAADRIKQLEDGNREFALLRNDDLARIEQLEAALRFYSDQANWLLPYISASPVVVDGGHLARAALEGKDG